jgi:bifunctional non-homologous end joining protein LigD
MARSLSGEGSLPRLIRPMLATSGDLPGPAEEERWAFEMKWDGVRAIVYVEDGTVRLLTRNDRDVSAHYPELAELGAALGKRAVVLDGEVVAFDASGRPSFGVLQARMHVQRPAPVLLEHTPVSLLLFDLLHDGDRSLLRERYDDRRAALEALGLDGPRWATPPAFGGDAAAAMRHSQEQGLEGVLAKRRDSGYVPGRRSRDWLKAKHTLMQEVVVCGWRPGEGNREGGIGSLLVGVHDADGRLVYAGHVGTGFSASVLGDLAARLGPLERKTSPFADEVPRADAKDAHWVRPVLVGEVRFGEWTREGRLRFPVWRGLRDDKSADQVVPES